MITLMVSKMTMLISEQDLILYIRNNSPLKNNIELFKDKYKFLFYLSNDNFNEMIYVQSYINNKEYVTFKYIEEKFQEYLQDNINEDEFETFIEEEMLRIL